MGWSPVPTSGASDFSGLTADTLANLNVAVSDANLTDRHAFESDVPVSGGDTVNIYFKPTEAVTVTEVGWFAVTSPVSAAGTYTCAATKNGGNTLLNAATYDLEGTLTNLTPATGTLTATGADLALNGTTDYVKLSFVSSLDDFSAGAGLYVWVEAKVT